MNKHLVATAIAAAISTISFAAQAAPQAFTPVSDGAIYTNICSSCNPVRDGAYLLVGGSIQGILKYSTSGLPDQISKAFLHITAYGYPVWAKSLDIYGYNTDISQLVAEDGDAGSFIGSFELGFDVRPYILDVTSFVATATGPYIAFNLRATDTAVLSSWEYGGPALLVVTAGPAVNPVPEPSTYAMLGLGLGVMGFAARSRKSV